MSLFTFLFATLATVLIDGLFGDFKLRRFVMVFIVSMLFFGVAAIILRQA